MTRNEQAVQEEASRRVGDCNCAECEERRAWFMAGALWRESANAR